MRHYFLFSDGYILTGEASKGAGKPSVLHGKARAMSLSPATTAAAAASRRRPTYGSANCSTSTERR